jgi:gliding motility-associated protein GldM
MMTKSKFNHRTKLKILAIVPIAVVLFVGIACVNRAENSNVVTAVAPVRMNVLYIGVDNPMSIAVSGYKSDDLTVSIDNGTITKKDKGYIINPKEKGRAIVTVSAKGKKVSETEFRVKLVPDPVAKLAGKKGGDISKSLLLQQKEIVADLENFDFDARFTIVSFTLSCSFSSDSSTKFIPNGNYVIEESSNSNKFTERQIEILKKLKTDQKFYIDNIIAIGPDGKKRQLPTLSFKIAKE